MNTEKFNAQRIILDIPVLFLKNSPKQLLQRMTSQEFSVDTFVHTYRRAHPDERVPCTTVYALGNLILMSKFVYEGMKKSNFILKQIAHYKY